MNPVKRPWLITVAFGLLLLGTPCDAMAQETELTAKVTKGDLKIEVDVSGVFVADDKDEIAMEPTKYRGDLIVTKLLAEGVSVKKGDVLMEFDTDKLDEALEDAQNEVTDADVELKKADAEHQSANIDAETKQAQLQKELQFLGREVKASVEKQALELAEKEKAISDAERQLADARVDFKQLTELYEERELHTATENILIEREKYKLADAEKEIRTKKTELAHYLKFDKMKTQLEKELEVEKKQAEIKKEKVTLEAAVAEKKSVVDKAQRKLDAATRKVDGLKRDRSELRVISPRNGILFYETTGDESPTGFNFGSQGNNELHVGGRVKTHGILLTVATMDNLSVKMKVRENDIQHMKTDLPITVRPDAFPSIQLAGKLTKVDQIASRTDIFSNARRFTVQGKCKDKAVQLKSGMNCRVVVHADIVPDAIQVPIVAVNEDGGKYYCYVKNGAKVNKREVKIGVSNDENVQITEGLRSGEVVYLSTPNKG